jgi:hypothetical protein
VLYPSELRGRAMKIMRIQQIAGPDSRACSFKANARHQGHDVPKTLLFSRSLRMT